jgi:hypothetical protein
MECGRVRRYRHDREVGTFAPSVRRGRRCYLEGSVVARR